jgi:hypothetical protein
MLSPKKLAQLRGDIRKLSEKGDDAGRIALAILVLQATLELHATEIGELRGDVNALKQTVRRLL